MVKCVGQDGSDCYRVIELTRVQLVNCVLLLFDVIVLALS